MLIRLAILERIQAGDVTLQYRRWKRATVKTGGTLKTRVGVLAIERVRSITEKQITTASAKRAGYDSRAQLLSDLASREGELCEITVSFVGADPRIALREQKKLTRAELDEVCARLARMDRASSTGPWTHRVLAAIQKHPELRAVDLAATLDTEKAWFKPNVRKLKALGLTISCKVGYRISPRGLVVLKHLDRRGTG